MIVAFLIGLAAIVAALGALGLAAYRKPAANEDGFTGGLGIALFDLASTLFISRPARLLAEVIGSKQKRSA